jgi:hypothetical protein
LMLFYFNINYFCVSLMHFFNKKKACVVLW